MNDEVEKLHDSAQNLLDAGQLLGAMDIYGQILELNSGDHDAWLMLGAIHGEMGAVDKAVECCRRALELDQDDAETRLILGRLLLHQGKLKETASCLEYIPREERQHTDVWQMLAGIYGQLRQFEEAGRCAEEMVRISPDNTEGYVLLSQARGELGNYQGAFQACREALRLDPLNVAVQLTLGWLHEKTGAWTEARRVYEEILTRDQGNLAALEGVGRVLLMHGDIAGAEAAYIKLLRCQGNSSIALVGLGQVSMKYTDFENAEDYYRQALQLAPDLNSAWVGLGNALQDQGKYALATPCYVKALEIDAYDAEAHYNQGVMAKRLGHLDLAEVSFDRAIDCRPSFVLAHWDRAFVLLMRGDYERGWQEYEWRLRRDENVQRVFEQPVWDGSPLEGQTILVYDEQGFGDTFQFVRYLPLLKEKGARVIFECHAKLGRILIGCAGHDRLIERDSAQQLRDEEFDVHIHLMSLPLMFGTTLENVPDKLPYLHPESDRLHRWKERLAEDRNFKIGIAWAGSPKHTNEQSRSCSLQEFAALADIPGTSFYSLQKGPGMEQTESAPENLNFINLGKDLDLDGAFIDTAAVMKCMDLVITIDTSIAHLAGAMGCPVWVMLCATPDWRWMQEREDTPWYPGMKLFRQVEPGQWSGVFQRIAEKLRKINP